MRFIDLQTQYQRLQTEIKKRMDRVLQHGQYIFGPEVYELEERLAEQVGVHYVIAVGSGSDALLMSLLALGIGEGDEVISPPFTFFASAETIALLGAKPVFVDIEPRTYNINPSLIEQAITPRTKAIVATSLYGQCADFDAINAVAKRHNLIVIEDGAQSFGAEYKGRQSCGLTTLACTSFFPSKPLGAYGDGGACFTNDEQLATTIRQLRVNGQAERYQHVRIGVNSRLDSLQAAVLLAKLTIFKDEVASRQDIAKRYTHLLSQAVTTPYIVSHNRSVFAQYTIESNERDQLSAYLQEQGIPTAIHYPVPIHLQPAFAHLQLAKGSFPVSERVADRVLSLPMHPYLSKDSQQRITDAICQFVGAKQGVV